MTDTEIVSLLFERSETGLTELQKKYARVYGTIIGRTLSSSADAEECANDLLFAVWKSIPPHRPDNLSAYVSSIARRLSADKLRTQLREKRSKEMTVLLSELEDCLPAPDEYETRSDSKEIKSTLEEFLDGLKKSDRVLFVRRYFFLEEPSELAKRFEIRPNAVSVSLYRSRKKLQKLLSKRGINL